jgi:methyl-accepting chemotaxis protein
VTLGRKLGVCLVCMVLTCAAIGAAGWGYVTALGNRLNESIGVTTRQIELAGELKANVFTFRLQERGMLLFSYIKAADQVDSCRNSYDKAMSASFDGIRQIRSLRITEGGGQLLEQAEAGLEEYKSQQLEVRKLLAAGQIDEATTWDKTKVVPAGTKINAAIDRFSELQHSQNAKSAEDAVAMGWMAKFILGIGLFACVPIGIVVAVVMRRTTGQLQQALTGLEATSAHLSQAAGQFSASSQSLAQSASEQASSLEETSASSEEINAMAHKNSENSRLAAEEVTKSQRQFVETGRSLDEMVAAMSEIGAGSDKISKIIKVIDDISFQTNILALNAAVEAARAGEAGMGFAVVADEVRNLAQRCAQAAQDTAPLIEGSIAKSNRGKETADHVAASIQAITASVDRVKSLVDEVSSGSEEQTRGITQVTQAISLMGQLTQTTAASAEESAAAAQELTQQSATMQGIMETLTGMVGKA